MPELKREADLIRVGFCKKRIAWPLMRIYATGLNAPEGLNFKKDTTGWVWAIAASLAKEKSASTGG